MLTRDQWRKFIDHPVVEWGLFAIGVLLLVVSPIVGAIPGPGGIIVAGVGLALMLKTSMWARRYYVRFKRWRPTVFGRRLTPGRWTDLALRRRSALRRERLRKEREQAEAEADAPIPPPLSPLPTKAKQRGPRSAADIAREWNDSARTERGED